MARRKQDRVDELNAVMRQYMAYAVLFQDAIARQAGLNPTDLQCLNLLTLHGPMTPGELSQWSGITAGGAITAVVDRLEAAALVHRERDTADRRRVLVRADTAQAWRRIGPLYAGVQQRWSDFLSTLTVSELDAASALLRAAVEINKTEISALRAAETAASGDRPTSSK